MKFKIFYLLVGLCAWCGCHDEENLIASTEPEPFLSLPQGENPWDDRIMDLYRNMGIEIFYKFEPKDVYFNYTSGGNELRNDTIANETQEYPYGSNPSFGLPFFVFKDSTKRDSIEIWVKNTLLPSNKQGEYPVGETLDEYGLPLVVNVEPDREEPSWAYVTTFRLLISKFTYKVECADSSYVDKQLDLLQDVFLNYYPSSLLREGLPPRIMLGKDLIMCNENGELIDTAYVLGPNNFILNYGNIAVDKLSEARKRSIKTSMNQWFVTDLVFDLIYTEVLNNSTWFELTDYDGMMEEQTGPTTFVGCVRMAQAYGWLSYYVDCDKKETWTNWTREMKMRNDLMSYLALIVAYSQEELLKLQTAQRVPGGTGTARWWAKNGIGRLSKSQDYSGLARKKYDALVDFLKTKNLDLAKAGEIFYVPES